MERHAAAPDHEYLKRIGKVPVEVVEEDVAQPAAQDDAEGRPQNEVAQVLDRHGGRPPPAEMCHIPPTEQNASDVGERVPANRQRSEEHTSELQSLMRISYAVFCLKKKKRKPLKNNNEINHMPNQQKE